mgnify:CR=1 FL=1|tara:strand:+ start:4689 stop:5891 length:1203 start_codon:yes stop_codon:yes gene_type:complete
MKKKVILVLIDACRGDYISPEKTPFLFNLTKTNKYYKNLVPSFGFCERTEIIVGLDSLKSNCFTAFGFSQELSPYRSYKYLMHFLGWLENLFNSSLFSKFIRRIIWEVFRNKKHAYYPARIPLKYLSDFCLTEDSALNLIEESNMSLYKVADGVYTEATTSMSSYLTGSDQSRLSDIVLAINRPYQFYPTYVAILDKIGHKYGPDSMEIKDALLKLDRQLEDFFIKTQKSEHDPIVVFCGDHGMSEITEFINIEEIVNTFNKDKSFKNNCKIFLDSTMARFWFKTKNSSHIDALMKEIKSNYKDQGMFIKRSEYKNFGIPDIDMYGDLLWVCNEGVVISPDYFNSVDKKLSGMHGYLPSGPQNYGFAIIAGKNIEAHLEANLEPLTKVYQEIKKNILMNK